MYFLLYDVFSYRSTQCSKSTRMCPAFSWTCQWLWASSQSGPCVSRQLVGSNPGTDTREGVAESVLRDLDISVNPCKNFFQFSCGGFIQNQSIPSGFVSRVNSYQDKVLSVIQPAIEEDIDLMNDPRPLILSKRLYQSCMNEIQIEMMGSKEMLQFISEMGGWQNFGIKASGNFELERMLAKAYPFFGNSGLSFLTGGAIIGINVLPDFRVPGKFAIYLDQPSLGQRGFGGLLNYELYFLDKNSIYTTAYLRFGVDIFTELGANPLMAWKDMTDILKFETQLAKIFISEVEQRRVLQKYNKLTIGELSALYPAFNWLRFFRLLGKIRHANVPFQVKDKVILWTKSYYDQLFPLLSQVPKRVISNYVIWRSIQPLITTINRKFQLISLQYDAAINGASEPSLPPRNIFCTGATIGNLQWVSSRILVDRHLSRSVLSKAKEIQGYIKGAFRKHIAMATWIDEHTRRKAIKKLDSIEDNIGFPDYLLNNKFLEEFYRSFSVPGKSFFGDIVDVYTQNYVKSIRQLVDPQTDRWILTPVTPNAVHERGRNAIVLSAAVLEEPLIRDDYPPALIFGAFGFLTAHEYQHAFDSTGISFDWNGLLNSKFWSPFSRKNFDGKANCFIKQYSNYYLTDFGIPITNGAKTLDEDLCDNVGLQVAYTAYQQWKSDKKYDDHIAGLPFNGDQLFFINVGRGWCAKWSFEFAFKFPLIDPHSINRLRVIGPLQNSFAFSRVFQCPLGSPMNPRIKCSFW